VDQTQTIRYVSRFEPLLYVPAFTHKHFHYVYIGLFTNGPPLRNYNTTFRVHYSSFKHNHLYTRGIGTKTKHNHLYTRGIRHKVKVQTQSPHHKRDRHKVKVKKDYNLSDPMHKQHLVITIVLAQRPFTLVLMMTNL